MRLLPSLLVAVLLAAGGLALPGPPLGQPAAAQEQAAIRAAEVLADQGHSAIRAGNMGRLEGIVRRTFALSSWEQFLLGNEASRFSAAQRQQFRQLLPDYLAALYARQFSGGLTGRPEIEGARPARGDILVRAEIPRTRGRALTVDWRMRRTGGSYKVVDFIVGGVSFLVLKRDEFTGIVRREGPDALLSFLRRF